MGGITSAINVESALETITSWHYTEEFILERNRLSVLFVANDLHGLNTLERTAEITVERNHTHVGLTCVRRRFAWLHI